MRGNNMKSKKEEWVRFTNNKIEKICSNKVNRFGDIEINGYSELHTIKAASIPHALVEEKDLIRVKYDCDSSEIEEVRKATGTDFICGDGYHIDFRDVIEILTPSLDGYDSQWKLPIK